jgi:hypothetical protein
MGALAGPAINILRMLFVILMQTAAYVAVSNAVESIVDYIRGALKGDGKLSEAETDDVMSNTTLDLLSLIGVQLISFKTRIPLRLADKLGLKVGRTQKVALTSKAQDAVVKVSTTGALSGLLPKSFLGKIALSFGASLPWLPGLVQQFGDQAAFAPKAANDYYEKLFGVRPFNEPSVLDSPGPFTGAEFTDYARSLEAAGVVGIEYGFPKGTVIYSKTALAELVDYVYGQQNAKGVNVTVAKLKPLLAPYLRLNGGQVLSTSSVSPTNTSTATKPGGASTSAAASLPAAGAGASTYQPVKVFTGIVSSGTLGASQPFNVKEDDMINSSLELRNVAQTNAAAFLATLPGRVVYELKIVNSVIAADGSKRVGATVQVPNGRTASGATKYKYVNNKFAVMSLYLVKKEGTRTKITDITLGPTDVAQFNPSGEELAGIGKNLVSSVATNSTNDISTIISDTPTETITTTPAPAPLPNYNLQAKVPGDLGYAFYMRPQMGGNPPSYIVIPDYRFGNPEYSRISEEEYRRATGDTKDYTNSGYQLVNGVFTMMTTYKPSDLMPAPAAVSAPQGGTAGQPSKKPTNLSEYYASKGQSLPSLAARGQTYQSLGLGAASLYTGTVEQNTKLLTALQGN